MAKIKMYDNNQNPIEVIVSKGKRFIIDKDRIIKLTKVEVEG